MGKQHQGRVYRRWRAEFRKTCTGICEMPECLYPGQPIWINPPPEFSRHPLAWTPDHIIPVSEGGQHVDENARHAHYGCNASRWTGKKRPGWKERGNSSSREY
jgi:5-methylcytosine-specific restriction endonuclease McrA